MAQTKIIKFMRTNFDFCIKAFSVRQKVFLIIQHIFVYNKKSIFCQLVFLFCTTLNIFSQMGLSFGCYVTFIVDETWPFVQHESSFRCSIDFWFKKSKAKIVKKLKDILKICSGSIFCI